MNGSLMSPSDRELVFDLANKLTGTMEINSTRHEIVIVNVARRMSQIGRPSLLSYLEYVSENETELAHFISAVTIHTTSWFREMPHYKRFERELSLQSFKLAGRKIRVLSAACSTGEELYSLGLVLEIFRRQHPTFDYELVGVDVDPLSVQRAEAGFYKIDDINAIPQNYRPFLLLRPKFGASSYLIEPEIRRRTRFQVGSIVDADSLQQEPFDYVFCRNVLIYFSEEKVNHIIANLLGLVKKDGSLTLGHSETIDGRRFNLNSIGASTYRRVEEAALMPVQDKPMTVLSIDDSPSILMWLTNLLSNHGIKSITAHSTEAANELMKTTSFDLITLDLNMPGQSGSAWLVDKRREGLDTPVIILTDVSSEQAPEVLDSLAGQSQDYVNKGHLGSNPNDFIDRVQNIVRSHRSRALTERKPATYAEFKLSSSLDTRRPDVIVVGASTGGTDALCKLLAHLPADCPPVVCVQHMPKEFAPAFLERLARVSGLQAATPEKGKELLPGHIYLPTLDAHVGLRLNGDHINVFYSYAEKVSNHRPSVDYLFQSATFLSGKRVLACLLTGMGRDGAQGMLELKRSGALTLAQDERSSVVWGMPGEAVRVGAPLVVGNLTELRDIILKAVRSDTRGTSGPARASRVG